MDANDTPKGKAVFVYLPGPYTLAYFRSHHSNNKTTVAIEVPGRVDLDTLNAISKKNFGEVWETLDPITEVVATENLIPDRAQAGPRCDKLLSACSEDDLVCELERRGWSVNIAPKK